MGATRECEGTFHAAVQAPWPIARFRRKRLALIDRTAKSSAWHGPSTERITLDVMKSFS